MRGKYGEIGDWIEGTCMGEKRGGYRIKVQCYFELKL